MITKLPGVAPFYEGWRFTNDRLMERSSRREPDRLAEAGSFPTVVMFAWQKGRPG